MDKHKGTHDRTHHGNQFGLKWRLFQATICCRVKFKKKKRNNNKKIIIRWIFWIKTRTTVDAMFTVSQRSGDWRGLAPTSLTFSYTLPPSLSSYWRRRSGWWLGELEGGGGGGFFSLSFVPDWNTIHTSGGAGRWKNRGRPLSLSSSEKERKALECPKGMSL